MFITYHDEFKERLFPLERIGLAEYQHETGKLVIWLSDDSETIIIEGDEAARVWAEIKSKKQKPEITPKILAERIEKIRKMVDWAEINRSPEDFIRIRLEINALEEEIRSHEPMIQERV